MGSRVGQVSTIDQLEAVGMLVGPDPLNREVFRIDAIEFPLGRIRLGDEQEFNPLILEVR